MVEQTQHAGRNVTRATAFSWRLMSGVAKGVGAIHKVIQGEERG